MKDRCLNPKDKRYHRYGGRGITVCKRWLNFEGFSQDMGATYKNGLTLERINNNGNYTPSNCVWIPFAEQAKNRSDTVFIEWNGKRQCMRDWERELGFNKGTLRMRLRRYGWSVERALSTKAKSWGR